MDKLKCLIPFLLGAVVIVANLQSVVAAQRTSTAKVVRKAEDLPNFRYAIPDTAQSLLASDEETFNAFAIKVKKNLDSIFEDYDLQDLGIHIHLLSNRVDLQTLLDDNAGALETCEQMRQLFDTPDLKVMGMSSDLSFLRARAAVGRSSGEVFQVQYAKDFHDLIESLPWEVVEPRVRKQHAKFEKLSVGYIREKVESEIEPYVTKNYDLDFSAATRLIFWRGELLTEVPQRQIALNILSAYIKEHTLQQGPPVAVIRPVTDEYFGTAIVDNYRYMEDLQAPEVQLWMKGQADYARSTLDSLPGREKILTRIKAFLSLQAAIFPDLQIVSGKYYLLKIPPGSQNAKLFVREGLSGEETLLIDPDQRSGPSGQHSSISFYAPSPDNAYVVYGLSPGGSENAVLHILDAKTGRDTGETIDRARYASPHWRDSQSFYYTRLQKLAPDSSPTAAYEKARAYLHTVGGDPETDQPVFGFGLHNEIEIASKEIPSIWTSPGLDYAVAVLRPDVDRRRRIYVAPLKEATGPNSTWRPIASTYEDGIVEWQSSVAGALPAHDNTLFMLSHKSGLNGEIVSINLNSGTVPAQWHSIIPAGPLPISAIQTGRDCFYVRYMDAGKETVTSVAYTHPTPQLVNFPFPATSTSVVADLRSGDAMLLVLPFSRPPLYLRLHASSQVSDAQLIPSDPPDKDQEVEVREVMARSWDNTEIPLTIVFKKGLSLDGSHPTLLVGYGAYGTVTTSTFGAMARAAYEYGIIMATAHVRGGGEYGEAWHLAGYKLTKPNTWRDFIACANYLIENKYTQASKLTGMGTSAGGILIGRAVTERPDLFAGAIANVGLEDTLRFETTANGPGNTPEFGSVKTQDGFEDLYSMSSYAHVRDGVKYPAMLLTAGMNDRRVEAWQVGKFAARLQAASASGKAVLFRVDYDRGHGGFGATSDQLASAFADQLSFVLWQAGDRDFEPLKSMTH
jgi:prolyl oligopeptidase